MAMAIAPALRRRGPLASRCRSTTPSGRNCRISGTLPDRWRRSGWLLAWAAARLKPSASSRKPGRSGCSDRRVHYYGESPDAWFALSPDGRRIAYRHPTEELVVRDLVSGESYSPTFEIQARPTGYSWSMPPTSSATCGRGDETDGCGGRARRRAGRPPHVRGVALPCAARRANGPVVPHPSRGRRIPVCLSLRDIGNRGSMPVLCHVVGVIGPQIALTHDGTGAVVALDIHGVEDPALPRVVVTAGSAFAGYVRHRSDRSSARRRWRCVMTGTPTSRIRGRAERRAAAYGVPAHRRPSRRRGPGAVSTDQGGAEVGADRGPPGAVRPAGARA